VVPYSWQRAGPITLASDTGLTTDVENDTTCCYARQDKVWVHGPGNEPWEVYTVKADSPTFNGSTTEPVRSTS
jgi:hypothetical protein